MSLGGGENDYKDKGNLWLLYIQLHRDYIEYDKYEEGINWLLNNYDNYKYFRETWKHEWIVTSALINNIENLLISYLKRTYKNSCFSQKLTSEINDLKTKISIIKKKINQIIDYELVDIERDIINLDRLLSNNGIKNQFRLINFYGELQVIIKMSTEKREKDIIDNISTLSQYGDIILSVSVKTPLLRNNKYKYYGTINGQF